MSTLSESELPAVFDIEHAVRIGDETYMPSCGKLSSDVEGKEWEDEMEDLATQGIPSPLHPYPMTPDPAAQLAVGDYRRAVTRYVGRCFRLRVSLVAENEVPARTIAALVDTVSRIPGAVGPVRVAGPEFAEAIREHQALGAPRLAETYRQGLPIEPEPIDELLDSLVDLPEAAAVLSLPAHWSGSPTYFDDAPASVSRS